MITTESAERFNNLYTDLLVTELRHRIGLNGRPAMSTSDAAFLVSAASRLAFSDGDGNPTQEATDKRKAYNIATLLPQCGLDVNTERLSQSCEVLLSRLGNFPARQLMEKERNAEFSRPIPLYLALESIARQEENTVTFGRGEDIVLTDFQIRLIRSLESRNSVSVSAPTSAGKSFTLAVEIIRRLQAKSPANVVYLVPTRALITQVMFDVIRNLNEHGLSDASVLCIPEPPADENVPDSRVYVLTQERFATVLNNWPAWASIDLLIVDEAQEISDRGRGLLLEGVIDKALRANPKASVFFSSPLRSNPEYLLTIFNRESGGGMLLSSTILLSRRTSSRLSL